MSADLNQYYLQQMGIQLWTERPIHSCESKLFLLERQVAGCVKCTLNHTRSRTVFAKGNSQAKLMIIGDAPRLYEEQEGIPFADKAGYLLKLMLLSVGLSEQDAYFTNVLKCRVAENKVPLPDEIAHCKNYLAEQISLVAPQVLLALGSTAGHALIKKSASINQLREDLYYYDKIPCLISYHPAHLLKNPADKKKAYSDLLEVKRILLVGHE
jgi:uracil-DNA glycosylase